ncbi:Cell cycle serine/threonine-protein kinase cdc5/MSD2 [Coemansia sp. RSA 2399]|nr:Cell cycle serine/threonine-protein kinase cdc5/MSD2 [Coemansia sp. RSA 2399]
MDKLNISSAKVIERLKYEVKVMRGLPSHPNVVASHHVFEDKSRVYILMELCTSRTLHDLLLKRKRLTEFEARYFTAQLAGGIDALHKANIIHRDIKHSNLLLDHRNRIKIADFGLSTILESESDRKQSFLGTPNFLAPELISRNGYGHSHGVDIWATGVLLFFMLYGRPPFNQQRTGSSVNLQQLYRRIVNDDIPFPRDPPMSTTVKSLISKLCCKKEHERISADEICSDAWFLIHPDSNTLPFMPDAIFQRPIRTLQEYKELVDSDPGLTEQMQALQHGEKHRQQTQGPMQGAGMPAKPATNGASSVAVEKLYAHRPDPRTEAGLSKNVVNGIRPSAQRRPLEPVPERENRLASTNLAKTSSGVPATAGPAASASSAIGTGASIIRTRRQARALAEAEKENRPVSSQPEQLKLGTALAAAPPSPRYPLRSRRVNGVADAARNGNGAASRAADANGDSDWNGRNISRSSRIESTRVGQQPARSDGASSGRSRVSPQSHQSDAKEESCRVEAEFGRVTKLSEEYIPSIMKWKGRLQKFRKQTAAYLERSSSSLEAELGTSNQTLAQNKYPHVGMYVLNWVMLPRYGLGFRLSDGTAGTLFNDNTSLLQPEGTSDYVYVRPFENRSSIGYYSEATFPAQLEKKRTLLHTFARHIRKKFSANVDRDISPEPRGSEIVKCLLQALSTSVGMVFLLTGNVLQFNMNNHSKLFLYKDAHIYYKSSDGNKWHFDLRQGPAMLIRDSTIDIEQFLLCLGYAQKVLESWNLDPHGSGASSSAAAHADRTSDRRRRP